MQDESRETGPDRFGWQQDKSQRQRAQSTFLLPSKKIEHQLKAEVKALTAQAELADQTPVVDGIDLPAEIARREVRLKALDVAKLKKEERAKERFHQEQAVYQRKEAKRQAQRNAGKKA